MYCLLFVYFVYFLCISFMLPACWWQETNTDLLLWLSSRHYSCQNIISFYSCSSTSWAFLESTLHYTGIILRPYVLYCTSSTYMECRIGKGKSIWHHLKANVVIYDAAFGTGGYSTSALSEEPHLSQECICTWHIAEGSHGCTSS